MVHLMIINTIFKKDIFFPSRSILVLNIRGTRQEKNNCIGKNVAVMLLYIEYIDCQWRTYPTLTCTWSALPWLLAGRDPAPVMCITSSPTPACPSPYPSPTVTGRESTQTQVKQYSCY